ncbi:MAG: ABC transporter permease [Burkholderiales bacterium]|nr:ABC transporter permease [Burkholderiales bacterium]
MTTVVEPTVATIHPTPKAADFSWARWLVVTQKEFTDLLRDRKSIFWALFAVAISGPLMVGLMYWLTTAVMDRVDKLTVPIVNAQFAPDLVRTIERQGMKIDADPPDYESRVKSGELDFALVVDTDFTESLAAGRPARITLITERSRDRSAPLAGRVSSVLNAWANQMGRERLILRGVSPVLAHPVQVEELDLATPEQRGSRLLQFMSFYALFAGLMGAIAAALDVTAGERERQTLEPLLTTPVTTLELTLGKWLAVTGINLIAVTTSLLGFVLSLHLVPLDRLGLPFTFGLAEYAGFMAVLTPFACMVPAVLLAFGAAGKTAKEAQSSLQMGVSLIGLLPLMSMVRQTRAPWWDAWVPVNGQYAVLNKVLRAETIATHEWAAMLAIPALIGVVALYALSRRLGDERMLAGR